MKTPLLLFVALLMTVTVSAAAYDVTPEDRAFFHELRAAVLKDDTAQVAALVLYPIPVRMKGQAHTLTSAREFTARYQEIMTDSVREAIRRQSAEKLRKNWQGVMIGAGAIWFEKVKPAGTSQFVYRVIALNP